jgi:hypothetical protein
MRRFLLVLVLLAAVCTGGRAQIVNRLKVDSDTFERYAYGRLQEFNPRNLELADSLYALGVAKDNLRYKCLGLSLEFPVRFAQGESARMDACIEEIKILLAEKKDLRDFYFFTLHEYCEFLLREDRMPEAMLEARAMERMASEENKVAGKMYAYRIVGLIQSYRDNSYLAIQNFEKAARYCKEARAEQDLPNLHILMAQEYINLKQFPRAEDYCIKAEAYQDFFPAIRLKAKMTRAYLYNAEKDWRNFWKCYEELVSDPLYKVQADNDSRYGMDIYYLISKARFEEALAKTDSLGIALDRHEKRHGIYAAQGRYQPAYDELFQLANEKDSVFIKVQNEDLAILDAEMNNAQLRQEAERLKHQNQNTILIGFLVMFAIAFMAILFSQWQLRQNLDEMRQKNNQMLIARRAYQKALDAKEAENSLKVKILQNRNFNTLNL